MKQIKIDWAKVEEWEKKNGVEIIVGLQGPARYEAFARFTTESGLQFHCDNGCGSTIQLAVMDFLKKISDTGCLNMNDLIKETLIDFKTPEEKELKDNWLKGPADL